MENAAPLLIANTYQIIREIGSGGGGIVYLAQHLRLDKKVVLKADKRSLSADPEVLKREVKTLKDMRHIRIPQVYDFIADGGTVYTVIDYIEGESLDKPLKRGQRFSQEQMIEWACQLLDALDYLHNRPPHGILHADIKPANIMVTPQGDIFLIDFNIALALGEGGAVAVGRSFGYASPEHYSFDTSADSGVSHVQNGPTTILPNDSHSYVKTVLDTMPESNAIISSGKKILLDARSDIYSLGATLYHILSGKKPPRYAVDVPPLSKEEFSPQIVDIITKAMNPDPNLRYQTAQEMRYAFEHLHDNDSRTRRYKRNRNIAAVFLSTAFLVGGAMSFIGLKQMEQAQAAAALEAQQAEQTERQARKDAQQAQETEQQAREALAAVRNAESAYEQGDIPSAVQFALKAIDLKTPYAAQAQKVLTDALGVYNLSDGFKAYQLLKLPGKPLKVLLSPRGVWTAAMVNDKLLIYDTATGEQAAMLAANPSALSDAVFCGEHVLIYAGEDAVRAYDLAQGIELWSGQMATSIALSADGSTVAAVYKDESAAVIYDAVTGEFLREVDFYGLHQPVMANDTFLDLEDSVFTLNADGSRLAVSFSNGALRIFDLQDSSRDIEIYDKSDFTHFEGGFFGPYFAFSARDNVGSEFAIIDTDNLVQTGYLSSTMDIHLSANESGIYVAAGRLITKLDPETMNETEQAYANYAAGYITKFQIGNEHTILTTQDGSVAIFDADANLLNVWEPDDSCDFVQIAEEYAVTASWDIPALRILKLEDHEQAQIFTYDADYIHDEARVSADGNTVMLFRYDNFRLYDNSGNILTEIAILNAEQVYDQQYHREGNSSYLEVIYNDGVICRYSAKDGSLFSETAGEVPDQTLYEEFFTAHLRITSPLHGAPTAYDRESGALIAELEPDAYLTYVTQVGDYIITEYISAQGERYGLLLNEACQTLAYLPNLCDILEDGTLVFDDTMGNLRQSRIYSTQELIALAKN